MADERQHQEEQLTVDDDDDGETLVRQVIAENPVEERGVREEWVQQVGWHRKDDVLGLRGKPKRNRAARASENQPESVKDLKPPSSGDISVADDGMGTVQHSRWMQSGIVWKGGISIILVGVLFLLRFAGMLSRRKNRRLVSFISFESSSTLLFSFLTFPVERLQQRYSPSISYTLTDVSVNEVIIAHMHVTCAHTL